MNNFGVYELASAKVTSAPGWAYVPDTGVNPAAAALQPTNRKRAARGKANPSASDLSVRQEAKIRKELEHLDRDGGRDASIPIPAKGSRGQNKSTPNIRKILQSQKTFHNHLDDYLAQLSHTDNAPAPHPNQHTPRPANKPPHPNQHTKRNAAKRSKTSTPKPTPAEPEDVEMTPAPSAAGGESNPTTAGAKEPTDDPVLAPYEGPALAPHPGDNDPLLASRVPEAPTDEELRWLLAQPMLSFWDARAEPGDEDAARYPVRTFCELCGYWGRVRCIKCGTRVCALDCLEAHREECFTRYGI
ncbi:HIT zinc finger protein [Colletotrichum navitas]|uniref:HIT zinc finger protein n=1 Tax=Colletotrichum navitas TaxID=681940 RepID=A0AAD8QCQ9_9PEZI|nr:HIT zinc finger protein [Colletotrichum navitas]KAK1600232.1 HIT zinc finger protein [Colletotrichum navitas]